ncbi:MAG: ATP-binding protein [Candidatus Rhabdochlamydia sp.]
MHRDYFVSAPVRLFIFDDRIEIINPGNLPDHLSVEKIRTGNSIQRNPILASFAAKGLLPYRGLGTSIRRALQDWPHIQFIDNRDGCLFTSLIERILTSPLEKSRLLKNQNDPINDPINSLTDLQIKILKTIEENPQAAYEELALKLEKDRSTIKRNIQQLKFLGILQRSGPKKKGFWKIMK